LQIEAVDLANGRLFERENPARGETGAAILKRQGREQLSAKVVARPGPERGESSSNAGAEAGPGGKSQPKLQENPDANVFSFHSFGAHFCEIRVDADLGVARVIRWVGVFDTGRVLNHRTARSQALGGIVWGIGNALMEATIQDIPSGAFLNSNLAEYHVAVSADIPELEVHFLDKADPHVVPLGIKSLGELGNVGAAAAIANAVFHATGRRVRDLPITPDKLLL
jgi:xanthine dehydrogenase YagR molybdenum-binding subunit